MGGQITGALPTSCISYGFHLRVCCGVFVDDHATWGLSDDMSRSIDDHGAEGLVAGFDSKLPHFECPSNIFRFRSFFRLFNVSMGFPDDR